MPVLLASIKVLELPRKMLNNNSLKSLEVRLVAPLASLELPVG